MRAQTADEILALARGFMESRILLSAAELDLFTLLARQSLTAAEVTQRLHGDERAVTILLDAVAGMGLLAKRDGRYRCELESAALLPADAPDSVLPMVLHSAALWPSWSELSGFARGDTAAVARARQPRGETDTRAFIGAMHVVSRSRAAANVAAIDPGPDRQLAF